MTMRKGSVALVLLIAACAGRVPPGRHGSASIGIKTYAVDTCVRKPYGSEPAQRLFMTGSDRHAELIRSANGTRLIVQMGPNDGGSFIYRCYDDPAVPWDAPTGEVHVACKTGDVDIRVDVTYDCRP